MVQEAKFYYPHAIDAKTKTKRAAQVHVATRVGARIEGVMLGTQAELLLFTPPKPALPCSSN